MIDNLLYNIFADIMIEEEKGRELYKIRSRKDLENYKDELQSAYRIMEKEVTK